MCIYFEGKCFCMWCFLSISPSLFLSWHSIVTARVFVNKPQHSNLLLCGTQTNPIEHHMRTLFESYGGYFFATFTLVNWIDLIQKSIFMRLASRNIQNLSTIWYWTCASRAFFSSKTIEFISLISRQLMMTLFYSFQLLLSGYNWMAWNKYVFKKQLPKMS